jgi:hypothetical protein
MSFAALFTSPPLDKLPAPRRWFYQALLLWESPWWSAGLALAVYTGLAFQHGSPWAVSIVAYYNYLADAFLHGQLHLRLMPPLLNDLVDFGGHYYLYWPPMPAIALMPFVAMFGVGFSDVAFTLGLAAINVSLVALVLQAAGDCGVIELSPLERACLVLFFALGTVHITLSPFGRVWHTGQLLGFMCVGLAYLAALRLHNSAAFLATGLALGGAVLTRNHLLFAGLWPAYHLWRTHRALGTRRWLIYAGLGIGPILLSLASLALYNWTRFGSPTQVGLDYHRMSPLFIEDYRRYGPFNLHYVPTNFFYQYLAYPFPFRSETWLGGSLFLLSPVFLAAFWSLSVPWARNEAAMLALTIALVNVPILLLMGTGWVQFGPRYTLDFTWPLLLLTAIGLRRWPLWLLSLLTLISIIQFLHGTLGLAELLSHLT